MVTLTCQRCGYEWEYGGESEWYATCPGCRTSVKVDSSEGSSSASGISESSDVDSLTVEFVAGESERELEVTEAVEELHERMRVFGEGQEDLRQQVADLSDQLGERGEEIETRREEVVEVAQYLKMLVEEMGGDVEYETVELDSSEQDDSEGVASVQEAAEGLEVDV